MKKLSIILCCLLLSISLTGCGNSSDDNDKRFCTINERGYVRIETEEKGWYLLVDTETKVQYLYRKMMYQANLACIVDADGKPILYEGELW